MANPKQALDALKAAKEAYKAKFKSGFYHASPKSNIKEFDPDAPPRHQDELAQFGSRGATYFTEDPRFSESFLPLKSLAVKDQYETGATMYPVSLNFGKHFDPEKIENYSILKEYTNNPNTLRWLQRGDWSTIENPEFINFLKKKGYDTFSVREGGIKNIGVFDPKNIRGKFAEYNPEHAESADFMKAEGGAINPIKSPRDMLFELANFPHMADGRQVLKAGSEMKKLVEEAIQRYIRLYKKAPPPEDVKALEAHAAALAQKPTVWHDPVTQARARHELATNPGLINPEDMRDPFLTQAMTGRGTKGTRQAPFTIDISDPNVQKSLEMKQMSGKLEDLVGPEGVPSITPATDALAKMSQSLEQRALSSGSLPLIERLKLSFFNKNKRQPTEDELNALIADYNPLRHQYGTAGTSIVTARPKTAKGMQDWRQKARAEGVPEAYLEKPPADYPQYLQAELDIAQGVQPGIRPMSEDLIKNPDKQFAGGGSTTMSPREMQAMMIAHGTTPSKFEDPYERAIAEARKRGATTAGETRLDKILRKINIPFAAMSAKTAADKLAEGDPLAATLHGASAVGSGMAATKKLFKPGLGVVGAASVPLSIEEAMARYERGDRTGAILSAIQAAANAAQMYPPTAVPATVLGLGVAGIDAFRDQPQYKSVMESTR